MINLSNKAFLKKSKDVLGTLLLTTKSEVKAVAILNDMQKGFESIVDQIFKNRKAFEEMILLSEIELNKWQHEEIVSNALTPAQMQAQMQALLQHMENKFHGLMDDVIEKAFRQGTAIAQTQINRIEPSRQPPTYAGLSPEDLRMVQMIQDADFQRITTLGANQIADAKRIILNGLNNGIGQRELVYQLQASVGNSHYNARRIVRTEITYVSNTAARKRYLQSGLKYWQWNTSIDEAVCEVCGPLHGVIVEIGESLNGYLSPEGATKNRGNVITQPPAHPFCRCGMSPAFKKEEKKAVKPLIPVKVRPNLEGFDRNLRNDLQQLLKMIPSQVKLQVKVLKGHFSIKKTAGNVVDDPEVKALVSQATLQKFAKATGLYIGGDLNRVFVGNTAGVHETTHEVGHAVFDEYLMKKPAMRKSWDSIHNIHLSNGDFITPRSSAGQDEHFADSLRFYLLEPEALRLKYPEIYDFMLKNIFLGNEKDSIITLEDGVFLMKGKFGRWKKYEI